jgi:hopanoid biosynthesis associated protein HpnK
VKRLIVTGDDFGVSPEVNAGIRRAHVEGILTSASLMVNEAAAPEAAALARELPTLAVGLHLALSDSPAALSAQEIPGLVDAAGRTDVSAARAGWRYYFDRGLQGQLEREIRAQLEKFLATGLPLDHVNGHQHLHMHPRVFAILLRCLADYGRPPLRLVADDLRLNLRLDPGHRWGYKLSHALAFGGLRRWCRWMAAGARYRTADRVWGLYQDGRVTRDHLLGLLRALPDGVTEIYVHPSTARGRAGRTPDLELQALIDPEVRRVVRDEGIQLTAYGRL